MCDNFDLLGIDDVQKQTVQREVMQTPDEHHSVMSWEDWQSGLVKWLEMNKYQFTHMKQPDLHPHKSHVSSEYSEEPDSSIH